MTTSIKFLGDNPLETSAALIDVRQLAELLKCSVRHVYRMADAGALPKPRRLQSLVRWSRREIEEWISAGCPKAQTTAKKGGVR